VELGCGVGVAGLALAAAAAATVPPLQLLLTDIDPHALRRVEHNAVLNRLARVQCVRYLIPGSGLLAYGSAFRPLSSASDARCGWASP
jgi:ribosomal protein L11 methylase PrmA